MPYDGIERTGIIKNSDLSFHAGFQSSFLCISSSLRHFVISKNIVPFVKHCINIYAQATLS